MDFEAARDELRLLREENGRNSEHVLHLWNSYLSHLSYKLGDEVWIVYEQVFVAALDMCDESVAQDALRALELQFRGSNRVKRLIGMYLEYQCDYAGAGDIYDEIVAKDPANTIVRKKKIAMLKGQGKCEEAIKELKKYLELFQSDSEAWNELCHLYLDECEYRKAAFCMEELILSNPHNHVYFQKYAEIKYTEGGVENMEIAKSYFAQAVKMNPDNIRSLYGLFLSATNLSQSNKISKNKKDYQEVANWSWKQISQRYTDCAGRLPDNVGSMALKSSVNHNMQQRAITSNHVNAGRYNSQFFTASSCTSGGGNVTSQPLSQGYQQTNQQHKKAGKLNISNSKKGKDSGNVKSSVAKQQFGQTSGSSSSAQCHQRLSDEEISMLNAGLSGMTCNEERRRDSGMVGNSSRVENFVTNEDEDSETDESS